MEKKPGQISSNTLGLRFMQNAARAREEGEREAAKARVRTEEEWEVGAEVRKGWGVGEDGDEEEDGRRVSYEPSYLPFLFPALENSNTAVGAAIKRKPSSDSDDSHETGGELEPSIMYKGRRKFGKHGREEVEEAPPSSQMPPPPIQDEVLPRGARSISSHGRAAASSSKSSKHEHRGLPHHHHHQQCPSSLPSQRHTPTNPAPTAPREFLKPPVDAPRSIPQKRRNEDGAGLLSHSQSQKRMDERGERKKKKRKEGIRE